MFQAGFETFQVYFESFKPLALIFMTFKELVSIVINANVKFLK